MIIDVHAHSGDFIGRKWSPDKLMELLDTFEIDRACISSERAIIQGNPEGNAYVYDQFVKPHGDRFIGYYVFNPHRDSRIVVEDFLEKGFKGVKLHPWFHQTPMNNIHYEKLFGLANEREIPVLFHTGGTLQTPDTRFATPDIIGELAGRYERVPFLVGHMGLDRWREVIDLARDYDNIYLDLTSSLPYPEKLKLAVDGVGVDRVLFGTDTPLLDPSLSLGLIVGSDLPKDQKEKILGGNVERLFSLY